MLDVARDRAHEFGVENVEFLRLELEWIDLPTASVDAVVCRWGLMLIVDPEAAAQEIAAGAATRADASRSRSGTSRRATRGRRSRPGR